MSYLLICAVALFASTLTLFSGFGLGTLLLPFFALVLPVELAVSATAIVHLLNNLFKLALVGAAAERRTVIALGLPAIPAALVGAWLLSVLTGLPEVTTYTWLGRENTVTVAGIVIAALIGCFALLELSPTGERLSFSPRWLPLGGLLMGLFGGLSGHQGALRSAFLMRCGLSKEAFIGTGVVCAVLVDVTRVGVYGGTILSWSPDNGALPLVAAASVSALAGAWIGKRLLGKVTYVFVKRLVGVLLLALALGLGLGLV